MNRIFIRSLIVCSWMGLLIGLLYVVTIPFWQPKQVINIFAWGNTFDRATIEAFEQKTGIRVNISYYTSNEELIAKLIAQKGYGYDLIFPTDYAIKTLIQHNLLKRIEHHKLSFLSTLNPALLNHHFDPGNQYTLPFSWEIFCLGIDTDVVPLTDHPGWEYIFDYAEKRYRVVMTNQSGEAMNIASLYAGYGLRTLNNREITAIGTLLKKQRSYVEAYSDARPDYFLVTKNCPVIVSTSSFVIRAARELPSVRLVIPREGSLMTIEHVAIPVGSSKADLVYEFLNCLYQPEVVARHVQKFAQCPAILLQKTPYAHALDTELLRLISMTLEEQKRLSFFTSIMPEAVLNELWISIKS